MAVKFRVIMPRKLDPRLFSSTFLDAAKQMGREVHEDFDEITQNWKDQPVFDEEANATRNGIELSVMTDNRVFKYYDQGNGGPTRIIRPVRAKALHWVTDDGDDVFVAYVHGYEGRKAVEKIEKMWQEKAPPLFELAMEKAIKESGHAV